MFADLGKARYSVRKVPCAMMASAGYADHQGCCDPPWRTEPEIWIVDTLRGKDELRVLIHEAIHGQDWAAPEDLVDTRSTQLADLLWDYGYRLR